MYKTKNMSVQYSSPVFQSSECVHRSQHKVTATLLETPPSLVPYGFILRQQTKAPNLVW